MPVPELLPKSEFEVWSSARRTKEASESEGVSIGATIVGSCVVVKRKVLSAKVAVLHQKEDYKVSSSEEVYLEHSA